MNPPLLIRTLVVALAPALALGAPENGIGSDHWAFRAITKPAVPQVRNSSWIQTPVDAFILARLEATGLEPAAPADAHTLLRRLSYNLTGLPPTFNQVGSFDTESSIERLLDSPQFGERWARHWLDVARYSDTKGYAYSPEEFNFVHAWLYRDWVVDALNDDLPFDRFLVLQLAADQLLERGQCAPSDLAAMGFLTLGRRFVGVEQDIIDDRIDTVTRGMLGLTISCSRCHDHKYDPIPAADYYALYSIFDNSHERMIALGESDDAALREGKAKLAAEFTKHAAAVEQRHLERVAEYLVATLDMSKVPRPDFAELFTKDDLNPTQIRRWHEFLSPSEIDSHPVFGAWKALARLPADQFAERYASSIGGLVSPHPAVIEVLGAAPLKDMGEVAARYGDLFKQHSGDPEIDKIVSGPGSPIAIPRDRHLHDIEWLFADDERNALKKLLAEVERRINALGPAAPHAIAMFDQAIPKTTRILLRGDYATQGQEVPRRAPLILGGEEFAEGSGRLELAMKIADRHNPLTARVIVNRLWHHHFGTGLVNTPSDLGVRSETPSHPELLDFLATYLIENDWSLKSVHRLIVRSAVFQQASRPGAEVDTLDPENRLLSFFPRRRLDFESMRDSLLAASGELDPTMGGRPGEMLGANASKRRSLYGRIDRQFLPNTLRDFDFANPELHSPQRHHTNVPQQALFFLNSPFVEARAVAFAKRVAAGPSSERIRQFFRIALQREPTAHELGASLEFIGAELAAEANVKEDGKAAKPSQWQYGYGPFDDQAGKLENFTPLPFFTGEAWGGGEKWPDAKLGWVRLTATGGHTGNDLQHAAVRRWVSPIDGKIDISGPIQNDDDCGDGVRAIVSSSRHGTLGSWQVKFGSATSGDIAGIEVAKGDTIDFIVDSAPSGNFQCDQFVWAPSIRSSRGGGWDARSEFGGKPTKPKRQLDVWERFAHSLLLSNALMFVD